MILRPAQRTDSKSEDIKVTPTERQHDVNDKKVDYQAVMPDIHRETLANAIKVVAPEEVEDENERGEIC
jgi:hypothetical protein